MRDMELYMTLKIHCDMTSVTRSILSILGETISDALSKFITTNQRINVTAGPEETRQLS